MIVNVLLLGLCLVVALGSDAVQTTGTSGSSSSQVETDAKVTSTCHYAGPHKATVKLVVTREGLPTEVQVAVSSGDACVDRLAVQAVKQYHFPAKAVPVHLQIEVNFADTDAGAKAR